MAISLQSSECSVCVCVCVCVCVRALHTSTNPHPHPPSPPLLSSHQPLHLAAIDVCVRSEGDVLIKSDARGIDLTSCRNDLLVFVKDRVFIWATADAPCAPRRHGNRYHCPNWAELSWGRGGGRGFTVRLCVKHTLINLVFYSNVGGAAVWETATSTGETAVWLLPVTHNCIDIKLWKSKCNIKKNT